MATEIVTLELFGTVSVIESPTNDPEAQAQSIRSVRDISTRTLRRDTVQHERAHYGAWIQIRTKKVQEQSEE